MENVIKSAVLKKYEATDSDLNLINQFTLKDLTLEDVFIFKINVCDNEIDRSQEAFTKEALQGLAKLIVGKTVIKDHEAKADNQVGRIYNAIVEVDSTRTTLTGDIYNKLVTYCYMIRGGNDELIREIEAGIKKEVSISCSVDAVTCNICNGNLKNTYCNHVKGEEYDGKMCYWKLENPTDVYEISLVAIPCQREAGTTKKYNHEMEDLIECECALVKSFLFRERI